MASSFTRFLDHTQRRTTVSRTSLDEWSARRRDLYLTTHNTQKRPTSIPSLGLEPTITAGERPETNALDRGHWDRWRQLYFDEKVEAIWNVMAHAQKPDLVFQRNGRVHSNRRGRHFSRLLAAEVCASAVAMLDTPCSEVVWRVLAIHSIRQFPLHIPSRAPLFAIIFQLESKTI